MLARACNTSVLKDEIGSLQVEAQPGKFRDTASPCLKIAKYKKAWVVAQCKAPGINLQYLKKQKQV